MFENSCFRATVILSWFAVTYRATIAARDDLLVEDGPGVNLGSRWKSGTLAKWGAWLGSKHGLAASH